MKLELLAAIIVATLGALGGIGSAIVSAVGSSRAARRTDVADLKSKLVTMEQNQVDVKENQKEMKESQAGLRAQQDVMLHRVGELEKKQDAANAVKERLVVTEQRTKSNSHRIDRLEGEK